MIRRQRGKYVLFSKDGKKVLGRHDTMAEAQRQEAAIEARKTDAKKLKQWADGRG